MPFHEFSSLELLSRTVENVKNNVCVINGIYPKTNEFNMQSVIANQHLLLALGYLSKGTGFLTSDGYVITAYHVIEKASDILCRPCTHPEFFELELIKSDRVHDIALLKPEIRWSEGIDIRLSTKQPKKGDLVFTLGYPLYYDGPEPILSVGFFSNLEEKQGIRRLVINGAFNKGNSGGPLFDVQGRLLGIVVAKTLAEDPFLELAFQILENPQVELIYAGIELPDGSKEEMTLSKVIRALITWIANNIQTNLGEAISAEYLV
jgi:S1-C subfamily serine protease